MKHKLFNKNILLPILSSLLLCVSFFTDFGAILIFVSLVPLFLTLSPNTKVVKLFYQSFLTTFIFIGACLIFWVLTNFHLTSLTFLGIFLVGLFCYIFYLFFFFIWLLLSHYLFHRTPLGLAIFAIPALWALIEFCRVALYPYLLFSGPWYQLGVSLAPWPIFIQITSLIGLPGLSFFIVLVNVLIYILIISHRKIYLLYAAIIIFSLTTFGFVTIHNRTNAHDSEYINILIMQPAVDRGQLESDDNMEKFIRDSMKKVEKTNKIDLIVWPEGVLSKPPGLILWIQDTVQELVDFYNIALLTGSPDVVSFKDTVSIRNSALLFIPGMSEPYPYHKEYLVPFGEYWPFPSSWLNIDERVNPHGAILPPAPCLKLQDIEFGTSLCYEAIFPYHALRLTRDGALFLVQILDEYYFNLFGREQLLRHATFRAVETNRWVVRCSNTGISTFISPAGKLINKLPADIPGMTSLQIPIKNNLTLYTRHPNLFIVICAAYLLFVFVYRFIPFPAKE